MSNKHIQLIRVTKKFQDNIVVKDVSFEIADDEFFVLLGPSGCGKSTTLRMIAGLEEMTEGKIIANQKDISIEDPKDRNMAFVFQNYALYPHMNVRKNLSYSLKLRKVSQSEIHKKIEWVSNLLKINELLERKPSQLSGGQRQRVALGRSLVRDPIAFLLDEPLSNLDAQLRVEMRQELILLQKKLSKTFIYVTHDQVEAMTMASRICVMNQGEIIQIGAPQDVYDQPESIFVARFLANPVNNILKSNIEKKFDKNFIETLGISIVNKKLNDCSEVYFSIRPENLFLTAHDNIDSIQVNIVQIENHGHELLISCKIIDNGQLLYFRSNKESKITIGSKINLGFNIEDLLFFDIITERIIK
tara:strand:+ start:1988 stop:3067 length:1080 start_codon:yes stop_codon:yes gene_type:complete